MDASLVVGCWASMPPPFVLYQPTLPQKNCLPCYASQMIFTGILCPSDSSASIDNMDEDEEIMSYHHLIMIIRCCDIAMVGYSPLKKSTTLCVSMGHSLFVENQNERLAELKIMN